MKEIHIGAIIAYEREKKKISRERLCEGIFTLMALKRLEEGDRTPSYFILERLMERLGKSMNKLEILLHERDYEVYYLRVQLEKA
ncbi:MAG: helix-turn-helix domain-containing protein, partial [Lachnospiraceae bacterium]|nr:helix-turn-helix domain-containing protein [Lachnospiraceae bacterium]